jgi:hypothetical protein
MYFTSPLSSRTTRALFDAQRIEPSLRRIRAVKPITLSFFCNRRRNSARRWGSTYSPTAVVSEVMSCAGSSNPNRRAQARLTMSGWPLSVV